MLCPYDRLSLSVMSCAGSGNQGLILHTISAIGEMKNIDKEK